MSTLPPKAPMLTAIACHKPYRNGGNSNCNQNELIHNQEIPVKKTPQYKDDCWGKIQTNDSTIATDRTTDEYYLARFIS